MSQLGCWLKVTPYDGALHSHTLSKKTIEIVHRFVFDNKNKI